MIAVLVVAALLVVGLADTVANHGKAYGNVFINDISVAGMKEDQIRAKLEEEFGDALNGRDVRIYASDAARNDESAELARQESIAQAEQVSVEEAKAAVTSWVTSASGLRATVPYDEAIQAALAAGRDGGPLARLALFAQPVHIGLAMQFDEKAVEELANAIDATIGEERLDSTVQIEDGIATAVKGRDGKLVDRKWLADQIISCMQSDDAEPSFVAEVSDAPSRTTYDQAQAMSSAVNRALNSGLRFVYRDQSWMAEPSDIGSWTQVGVAQVSDGYELKATIDQVAATSDLAKHLDASAAGQNVVVDFVSEGDKVMVKTSGAGIIPEVGPAVQAVQESLYGSGGVAWGNGAVSVADIQVGESDAPEELTVEQAIDLGVVGVVGEYTTEFSNAEGTENRNHNIRLAADILNNTTAEANGGKWSFNEHSGDTNLDPPFASAGSIVDGEYVDSIGGGICQVATTVFNAVYEAGLDVEERHNHSLYIASYPTGRDAAVSYPEMDFVWSNPHVSDVLLTMEYTDTTVTAKLYSTPIGYRASTETGEWEEGARYKTTFETDENLGEGTYYLKTTGSDGSEITVTRTVYDLNGNIVKQDAFMSVYAPKDEVYVIGPGTDTAPLVRTENDYEQNPQEQDEWEPYGYDESYDSVSYAPETEEYAQDFGQLDYSEDSYAADDGDYYSESYDTDPGYYEE